MAAMLRSSATRRPASVRSGSVCSRSPVTRCWNISVLEAL